MRPIGQDGLKRRLGDIVFCGDSVGPLVEDQQGFYIKSELRHIRDCALGNGDEISFEKDISRNGLPWPGYLVRL